MFRYLQAIRGLSIDDDREDIIRLRVRMGEDNAENGHCAALIWNRIRVISFLEGNDFPGLSSRGRKRLCKISTATAQENVWHR
jgi:hypothetical protein